AKVIEGRQHVDRDAQFRYLAEQVGQHVAAGQPVVSVDCKKKENVGEHRNGGGSTARPGGPNASTCTTFPTRSWVRPSRTASTTCRPTPGGCRWATTMTPALSPWLPYGPGGTPSARPATRTPTGCSSAPTAVDPTAPGSVPGKSSSPSSPSRPDCRSR